MRIIIMSENVYDLCACGDNILFHLRYHEDAVL
jgi:hypothetical protein